MNKNILLFSVNRHQKTYFDCLLGAIRSEDRALSLHMRELLTALPSFCISKRDMEIIREVRLIRAKYAKNKAGQNIASFKHIIYIVTSLFFLLKIKKFLAKNSFDIILLWNDMKWHQYVIKKLADEKGIKTAFFENGTLPNTVTFDNKGVNYNNSVPRESDFYLNDLQKKEENLTEPRSIKSAIKAGYIFVPFQVDYDTQIISHSPWLSNMEEFYMSLQRLLKVLPDEIEIYVKEHPASAHCYQYLHNRDSRIVFKNDHETENLIVNSEMVITINSTVGLESIIKNKPVIVLGNAFYAIDGLCQHAKNEQELISQVQTIFPPNIRILERFLSYLSVEYYVPGNWRSPTKEHIHAIEKKLSEYLK